MARAEQVKCGDKRWIWVLLPTNDVEMRVMRDWSKTWPIQNRDWWIRKWHLREFMDAKAFVSVPVLVGPAAGLVSVDDLKKILKEKVGAERARAKIVRQAQQAAINATKRNGMANFHEARDQLLNEFIHSAK